jgi:RNA polymerase sigma factor (TIGR02999 family)
MSYGGRDAAVYCQIHPFPAKLCPIAPIGGRVSSDVTQLIRLAATGDDKAAADLLPLVYTELRRLADSKLQHLQPGQTLQPTALVHEVFIRLVGKPEEGGGGWEGRPHFFFAAARAMRDIIVERARAKATLKRGGDRRRLDPDTLVVAFESPPDEVLALDEALLRLEQEDAAKHQLVMLRFFAGLTMQQCAEALQVPARTLDRQWRFVRAWLHRQLSGID